MPMERGSRNRRSIHTKGHNVIDRLTYRTRGVRRRSPLSAPINWGHLSSDKVLRNKATFEDQFRLHLQDFTITCTNSFCFRGFRFVCTTINKVTQLERHFLAFVSYGGVGFTSPLDRRLSPSGKVLQSPQSVSSTRYVRQLLSPFASTQMLKSI